jgi:dihydrolipoamide dehydrogenase
MLIHHADVAETVENSGKFDIDASLNGIDYGRIVTSVNAKVSEEAEGIRDAVGESPNHTLYSSKARFVDDKVLEVDGEQITAEKIFIAAGTRPLVPPVEGIETVDYLTSREALELDEQPEEMVIIGGGYIACEMAHFFEVMGTEVTILEMSDSLVSREDADVSAKFTQLAEERYNVELGLKATSVEELGGKVKVTAEDEDGSPQSFSGDELLVAAGRIPNTDQLEVEETGIETDDRGFVETDLHMETSVEDVYAIGDIAGNYLFKHNANHEAEVAAAHSLGHEVEVNYNAMPHAIFSSPQIAGVGKTEGELREEDVDYQVGRYSYEDTGMGLAMKEKDGFVKVLASEDGEILGCHIIGPHASQLIHEPVLAMRHELTVEDIQDTIHVHPALNEVVQRAFNRL